MWLVIINFAVFGALVLSHRVRVAKDPLVIRERAAVTTWRTNQQFDIRKIDWTVAFQFAETNESLTDKQKDGIKTAVSHFMRAFSSGDYDEFASVRFPLQASNASTWVSSGISNLVRNLNVAPADAANPETVYRRFWEKIAQAKKTGSSDAELNEYCISCLQTIAVGSQRLDIRNVNAVPVMHEITKATTESGTWAFFDSLQSYRPQISRLKHPIQIAIYTVVTQMEGVPVPVPIQIGFVWDSEHDVWLPLGVGAFLGGYNLPTLFW